MKISKFLLPATLVLAATLAGPVQAQEYPNKPIRIVVPFPPGGLIDRMARLVGERLQQKWGQTVLVENRAGSGGNLGAEYVAQAAPDGYTLLLSPPGPLVINKALYGKLNFDPEAFVPVTVIQTNSGVLLTNPKVDARNVRDLLASVRAFPDRYNYSSGGSGSSSHLTMELFKSLANIKIQHIPYKGNAPAMNDLIGGVVHMTYAEFSAALPQIKAGKVKAMAVGTIKRNPALPDVPALSEVVPGFVSQSWSGIVAPPGTPATIAEKLSTAIAEILKQPAVVKQLADASLDPIGNTPAEMALWMKQERERWGDVIRSAGVKAD